MYGLVWSAAGLLFWIAWALMPGVGVTDAQQIFDLVSSQRSLVVASVVVQLVSAALYGPALVGLVAEPRFGRTAGVRWGAALLLIGAMGSAADAVLHLLAFAMTAPNLDGPTLVRVMAFMQGGGLILVSPLILCFFVGGGVLSVALAKAGVVSRTNAWLHAVAVLTAIVGGALASAGLAPARIVGLLVLGIIAAAQIWTGLALWQRRDAAGAAVWQRRGATAG